MKLMKEEENNISISASCEETTFGFDLATMTNPSCDHRLTCMRSPHACTACTTRAHIHARQRHVFCIHTYIRVCHHVYVDIKVCLRAHVGYATFTSLCKRILIDQSLHQWRPAAGYTTMS